VAASQLTWPWSGADVQGMQRTTINVGSRSLTVTLARSPSEWARGLVGQPRDCDGLLMIMPRYTRAQFHMHGVPDPVLLALYDSSGQLVDTAWLAPETGTHTSRHSFSFALELVGAHAAPEGTLGLLADLSAGLELP
jgi:uncharacterized membrane protein (UPF0127 family)